MLDIFTQSEVLSTYPFIDEGRDWPEGAVYRYDRGGHELLRILRGVPARMVAAVAREPVELALVLEGPLVVVCSRVVDVLPWAGVAYHWHRVRRSERILPPSAANTTAGAQLDLMLMEAAGGRVRAVRPLTLPVDFTRVLHEAILDQARYNFDPVAERRALDSLQGRCPTPGALVGYSTIRARIDS